MKSGLIVNVEALADEYAEGHLGRLAILNGVKSTASFLDILSSEHQRCCDVDPTPNPVELLSHASGLNALEYMKLHTLLPFSCFALDEEKRSVDSIWSREIQILRGLHTSRPGGFFCVECVKEDIQFRGFSYWRRSHQLPGKFWCDKHPNSHLLDVDSKDPFARLPQNWINDPATIYHELSLTTRDHPMVIRFNECCQTMLDAGRCLDKRTLRSPLTHNALLAGINVYSSTYSASYPRFSDLLAAIFPTEWLELTYPFIYDKSFGEFLPSIDSSLVGNANAYLSLGTAFALTLVFDSMTTAFQTINAKHAHPRVLRKKLKLDAFNSLVDSFLQKPGFSLETFNQLNICKHHLTRDLTTA